MTDDTSSSAPDDPDLAHGTLSNAPEADEGNESHEPWQTKRMLIWGTTYPEFSKKYFETVCTGAIDEATGKLMRIYPITLRYQTEKFKHYQWIRAEVRRNSSDCRPESHRIRQDSIELGPEIDPNNAWGERSKWVLTPSNIFASLEDLLAAESRDSTSLGLIKPATIERVRYEKKPAAKRDEWELARAEAQAQRELFVDVDMATRDLMYIDGRYVIDFTCVGSDGPTKHSCSVLDWGTYVLHRKMIAQHGGGVGQSKVIERIRECVDQTKKDAYLFMGNSKAHPRSFSIAGFYYPPREKAKQAKPTGPVPLTLPGFE